MTQEPSNFEIDVYVRLATQQLLLQQLFVQFANLTENPEETLAAQESSLIEVMSKLRPPPGGIEQRHITLLQMQRHHGPEMLRDFFRLARSNLQKR